MRLVKCRVCCREIAITADRCPACGCIHRRPMEYAVWTVVFVVMMSCCAAIFFLLPPG